MEKKIIAICFCVIALFAILQGRLMLLTTNTTYAAAAKEQSEFVLPLGNSRGNIFDCNFIKLTNVKKIPYALVSPGEKNYKELFESVMPDEKSYFYAGTSKMRPFLIPLTSKGMQKADYVFNSTKRYFDNQIATHIIGYVDKSLNGCSGVELAFNNLLTNAAQNIKINAKTNAKGEIIEKIAPKEIIEDGTGNGIMLSIDARIQSLCEAIAIEKMDKGSIVVMETTTGRIKASVSMPLFNPDNAQAFLNAQGAPFINRSISQFCVGSVFKPLLAAQALEMGMDSEALYNCTGNIEVDGHIYKCAYGKGHGEIALKKALEISCNCYFVQLGQALGGEAIYKAAHESGFGESTVFANNIFTAKGNLPSPQILKNSGELANISFGQGQLMATPTQIAAFMNIFANDGRYISPTFVEAVVSEPMQEITKSLYAPMQRQCISIQTAQLIKEMLTGVVNDGLAQKAKPQKGFAAGKTGTAQTGRFLQDGQELMDSWFAGFFPADKPLYTVVVLLDEGTHSSDEACEIFADIANTMQMLFSVDK